MANDDLISRQAAIDALCEDLCGGHEGCKFYPCDNLHPIQELPSAERHGRWIEIRNVAFPHLLCSECKNPFYGSRSDVWNYCPNCGARMEADE